MHKHTTYQHLMWYSSCLLCKVTVPSSAILAILIPCWKGAFVMFYLWDIHMKSTRSIDVKVLTCRHLQCYSDNCLVNVLHSQLDN